MLKWTSESEYFLSFENFFADTIYHIQSKSNHFTPSAAHARRGVTMATLVHVQTLFTRLLFKAQGTRPILMRQFSALQILISAWIKSKEQMLLKLLLL